jgi:rare lipoprotein A
MPGAMRRPRPLRDSAQTGRERCVAAISIAAAATAMAAGLLLSACQSTPAPGSASPAGAPTSSRPGGYYKDDGPGDNPPANLEVIPDAIPRLEPLNRFANRPYVVFGKDYVPATSLRPYKEHGIASWYGRKFHNQKTSTGEIYDMYAMTAAHPTLPLPSYVRVTNTTTGKSVIVRVNDRGPFHPGRVIDLSYAAAYRIGIAQKGSGEVDVEAVLPSDAPIANVLTAPLPPLETIASTPAPTIPVRQDASGYLLQLGAFANNVNAQALIERIANQLTALGVEARVRQNDNLFRVVVGPYPTREDARQVADRLRAELGLDTTVKSP